MHCDVISVIFAYFSKLNFSRKKQDNEVTNPFYVISTLRSKNVGVKFRCINTLTYMLQYWGRLVHQEETVNQNIRLGKYGLATKCKTYINRCMALRKQQRIYPLHSA